MIQLKSAREIELMAQGGAILGAAHALLRREVRPGISTWELDRLAEEFIRDHDGAVPAFKGLYGFPGSVCISLNAEVVHGIPSRKRLLADGDLVSLDIGVKYAGYFTDAAVTLPVGGVDAESTRLLEVTERALHAGIAQSVIGNHIGDIGFAVQNVVEREGFSVVRDLVGHGVGTGPHEEPQVPNYGKPKRGVKIDAGLTIAIEPMVNAGTEKTKMMADKWTVVTIDGKRSAHFEHTIAVSEQGPRILTGQPALVDQP